MLTTAVITPTRRYVGWVLLGLLLVLRLPVVVGGSFLGPSQALLARQSFQVGTYALNALLILWERDRLEQFHVDGWALGVYLLAPVLGWPILADSGMSQMRPWFTGIAVVALLTGLALLVTRTRLPRARRETLVWFGVAILAGAAVATITGFGFRLTGQPAGLNQVTAARYFSMFLTQVVLAASLEEPLFRGFLWGYLKEVGWPDSRIWLLQAGLFWLGHLYYFGSHWFSWWVVVPMSGLVIGWVAWRSRSIGASMVTHGIINSLGDAIGHMRW